MKRIGKNQALELVQRGAMLIDMRSPVAFRDGHVTGAVNLPFRNFLNTIQKYDRKQKFVIYSTSVQDDDICHGTMYADGLGYANIFVTDYSTLTGPADVETPRKKEVEKGNGRKGHKRDSSRSLLLRGNQ